MSDLQKARPSGAPPSRSGGPARDHGSAHAAARGAARTDPAWLLLEALHRRRAVHLRYGGAWRVVHPHAMGPTRTGKRAVLSWQTAGAGRSGVAEGWRLFDLARIEAAEMLGAAFQPRPRPPSGRWTPGVPDALAAV